MTTAEKDIFDGGMALIRDISDRPPTAWPNVKPGEDGFVRPEEGPWLEVTWFPGEPQDPWWSTGPQYRVGFFQILVCCRPDEGAVAIDEAQRIIAALPKGSQVGGVQITKTPWLAPMVQDDDRVFIPVTVPYQGLIT